MDSRCGTGSPSPRPAQKAICAPRILCHQRFGIQGRATASASRRRTSGGSGMRVDHGSIVKRFAADLEHANDLDEAVDVLHDAIYALGWPQTVYGWAPDGIRPRNADPVAAPLLVRNFPNRWDQKWPEHGAHDPYFHASRGSLEMVDWADVQLRAEQLPAQQRACMAYAADRGIDRGLTVPVHVTGRRFAFVTAVGEPRGVSWSEQVEQSGNMLMLIAHYFDNAMIRLFERRHPDIENISQRERECLAWSARGKTVDEIATILDLSADTVRVYLKRINRKLNTANRTHAVAKAVYLGLIDFAEG